MSESFSPQHGVRGCTRDGGGGWLQQGSGKRQLSPHVIVYKGFSGSLSLGLGVRLLSTPPQTYLLCLSTISHEGLVVFYKNFTVYEIPVCMHAPYE